jgi:hypothetical protein
LIESSLSIFAVEEGGAAGPDGAQGDKLFKVGIISNGEKLFEVGIFALEEVGLNQGWEMTW